MKIANYDEFIQVINSLFNSDEVNDFTSFTDELAKSKKSRNIKHYRYETELKKLKADAESYKQKLRKAQTLKDKQQYSECLKELNRIKRELIKKHKQSDAINLFNEMRENAKIYACCRHLLTKYLPQALLEDLSRAAEMNPDGSISINPQTFKDSRLYQHAAHIKDYVSSYFENYPERIKGTRYFVGLHKISPALSDLLRDIDSYFEKLNSPSEKESNRIKKSHNGINTIKTYPKQHLQIVQLLNKTALKYEGSAMQHCVGSYASRVEKGETQIYSLRDIGDASHELIPHATVEVKDGKIKQIKGYRDSVIAFEYVDIARDMLLKLIKSKDFQDIVKDEGIPMIDKNNIGLFKDINGRIHDLFNLDELNATFENITITEEALTALPMDKIHIKRLQYRGKISQEGWNKLLQLKNVGELSFSKLQYWEETLDCSLLGNRYNTIEVNAPNVKQIIFSPKAKLISLNGKFDCLEILDIPKGVEILSLKGDFPQLIRIDSEAQNITLEGKFSKLETLSQNVLELGIKGEFPKLKININILQSLDLQSPDIIRNTDWINAPALHSLYLYGEGVDYIEKLPKAPLLEDLRIGSETFELGSQASALKSNFTAGYPLLQSLILNGKFTEIEELDLSINTELTQFEALGSKFEKLKSIKFPHKLNSCVIDFTDFPMLKELDFSLIDGKEFGKLEDINIGGLKFGSYIDTVISKKKRITPHIKGISATFSHFANLEVLKFPLKVEKISLLNFANTAQIHEFNFDKLGRLKELDLSLCQFGNNQYLDLSNCNKLTNLSISGDILKNTTFPPNMESLTIMASQSEVCEISMNDNDCTKLKELKCYGFLPDEKILKSSVENLVLRANNQTLDKLVEINMAHFKYVDMQLNGSSLPKLKKVVFPQKFKPLSLYNTSSDFNELDFSQIEGEVKVYSQDIIKPNKSYYTFPKKGVSEMVSEEGPDNFLLLTEKQMQNIRNIRIGKNTILYIYDELPTSPDLVISLPADMSERQIKINQEKNPQLKFIKDSISRNNGINMKELHGKDRN